MDFILYLKTVGLILTVEITKDNKPSNTWAGDFSPKFNSMGLSSNTSKDSNGVGLRSVRFYLRDSERKQVVLPTVRY